jgi:hypothetical protein
MKKLNEKNACDAFITILKSLTDIEYKSESPDEVNRRTPDVDFVLTPSVNTNDRIAVEHTRVESFDEQIKYVTLSGDVVREINDCCRERIPPDHYYFLNIPPQTAEFLVGKSRTLFVRDLSSWVKETAQKLLLVDSRAQTDYKGHKITLTCRGNTACLNGNVWCMPQEPENPKALQSKRLERAIRDKSPKLTKYKEQGYKTALLLEDVAGTLRGSTLRGYEMLEEVDYIVVFVSNEDRMIIGNVWKERSVWYSSVPSNRRFRFPREPQHKSATRVLVE